MIKHGLLLMLLLAARLDALFAQKQIKDKHITYQQERMVFKQWDRRKFTPSSGFLGLNPEYWLTWAWHPNYPKTDLRPLSAYGAQTQRMGMVAVLQGIENAYKLQTDTFKNTAISEALNYSPVTTEFDPLWLLYYRKEFDPLLNLPLEEETLKGLEKAPSDYLIRTGALQWYMEESEVLKQRLGGMMDGVIDRGARITGYHLLLQDYRKLLASWETRKRQTAKFLLYKSDVEKLRNRTLNISDHHENETDREIAERILKYSRL